MNNEEMDIYIKRKIKDSYIPEKIDNLFNNSTKIIESKGEKQMEENLNMNQNQEPNKNNQKKPEKKKIPVALKRVLATAACLTLLLGGGNIYASTQGYDNIFFLIAEKLGISTDVFGKENILSDRDITISYRPIEIAKGTQIQINNLVIKDNKAKLKLQVKSSEVEKLIVPLKYVVKDENGNELCNYTSSQSQTKTDYKEELVLKNYKEETKKLELEILKKDDISIVKLEIDLENKKINVIGNEQELTKISEEELKQYLGAFATLTYKGTEPIDFSKETIEVENTKKMITALQIAKINNINLYTEEKDTHGGEEYTSYNPIIDKEKVNNMLQSFTTVEFHVDGQISLVHEFGIYPIEINGKLQYSDGSWVNNSIEPTCLEVTNIDYIGGIYNVTFKFCYSTNEDKGFGTNSIEDLPVYEMSMGLILDENNEYSKYRVSTMSEATLIQAAENNQEEVQKSDFENCVGKIYQVANKKAGEMEELEILSVADNKMTFNYYEYDVGAYKNIVAEIKGNTAKFTVDDNKYKEVKGELSIENKEKEAIKLLIEKVGTERTLKNEKTFLNSFKYEDFIGGVWQFEKDESGLWNEIQIQEIKNGKITFQLAKYRSETTEKQVAEFRTDSASIAPFNIVDTTKNINISGKIELEDEKVIVQITDSNGDFWKKNTRNNSSTKIEYEDYIGVWVHEGENGEQFEIIISDINNDQITCELLSYRNVSYGKLTSNFGWDTKSRAYFDFSDNKTGNDRQYVDIGLILDEKGLRLYTQNSSDYNLKPSTTYNELKHLKYEDYIKTWRSSESNLELNIFKIDQTGIEFELIVDGKSYGIHNEKFGFESAAFAQSRIKDEKGRELLTVYMDFRGNGVELNIAETNIKSIKSGVYNLESK